MPHRLPLAHDLVALAPTTERPVRRGDADQVDRVVVEEPLEIRLDGEAIAVTMRTPGHEGEDDLELAAGFLYTETTLTSRDAIAAIGHGTRADDRERRNIVEVTSAPGAVVDPAKAKRSFFAGSSCGLCGKATLDAIHARVGKIDRDRDPQLFSRAFVLAMPEAMRAAQATFASTGGLHAAAIFDARGALVVLREDIGRHNATDKVIGRLLLDGKTPCRAHALLVSGRAGFEIVQKAAVAQIPVVAAVSAPSSLSIDLAERLGVTLIAFLRPPTFGVYTHPFRITP